MIHQDQKKNDTGLCAIFCTYLGQFYPSLIFLKQLQTKVTARNRFDHEIRNIRLLSWSICDSDCFALPADAVRCPETSRTVICYTRQRKDAFTACFLNLFALCGGFWLDYRRLTGKKGAKSNEGKRSWIVWLTLRLLFSITDARELKARRSLTY